MVELQTGNRVQLLRKEAERVRGYTPEGERDATRQTSTERQRDNFTLKTCLKIEQAVCSYLLM